MIANTETSYKRKYVPLTIFCICLVLVFASEPLYREPLFNASLDLERDILDSLSSSGKSFFLWVSEFGTHKTFVVYAVLIFNYSNIYKSYLFLMIMLFGVFLTGLFKNVYTSPRPYFVDLSIKNAACDAGWGNPSGHSLSSISVYLTLWHIITNSPYFKPQRYLKYALLILAVAFSLLIMASRICLGVHSLNQILFGGLIGLLLYVAVFYVLQLDTNNPEQLLKILKIRLYIYFPINLTLFFVALAVFAFNNPLIDPQWIAVINDRCKYIAENKKFSNEGLLLIPVFISNVFMFLSLKLDLKFNMNDNAKLWSEYNFTNVSDNVLLEHSDDLQWNHTLWHVSLLRMLVIALIAGVVYSPYLLVKYSASFGVVLVIKIFIPMSLALFVLYYPAKYILRKAKLTNEKAREDEEEFPSNINH